LRRPFIGSAAEQIVRHAPCSVSWCRTGPTEKIRGSRALMYRCANLNTRRAPRSRF
jgi:hypothetical protein